MKIERTRNAARNVVFGTLYKAVTILFPFAMRTVMLYIMGSEYVGLNSLFTSILSFLSLAELGVGTALVYSMYKPIAEDDDATICALLNLYRKLYRWIGIIIAVIGVALIPFLPYLVKSDCPPDVNLYILYGIYLFNTVISYFMYGYKQSLLTAFQRSDIISKRSMTMQILMYVFQIIALILFKDYYIYIIWMPIFTIATNIANAVIVDKMFPQYKCRGNVSKEISNSIKKKVLALFGTKANSIVLHAADNIVISAFLGLVMVGKYGNYYYIMNSIIGVMTIIYDSLTAGLGNSLETESVEKNYKDFKVLSFMNAWLVAFCSTSLLCLYQPFMRIWVHEELMFGMDVVVLLVAYFYIYQIRRIVLTYKDAGGIWWEDRFRPYIVMVTNIAGNLVLVQFVGIHGVIISTIFSMIISIPWENYTVFAYVFFRSSKEYYKQLLIYILATILVSSVTYLLCIWIPEGVIGLIIRAIICIIVPNLLFCLFFYKSEEMKSSKKLIKERFINKLKL